VTVVAMFRWKGFFLGVFVAVGLLSAWGIWRVTHLPDPVVLLNRTLSVSVPLKLRPDKPLLVLYFRTCEGCELSWLLSWAKVLEAQTWRQTMDCALVVRTESAALRKLAQQHRWRVPALADPKGRLEKALGVRYDRHAFGFVQGKLVWQQENPEASQSEILQAFLAVAFGRQKARSLYDAWVRELRLAAWGKEVTEQIERHGGHPSPNATGR